MRWIYKIIRCPHGYYVTFKYGDVHHRCTRLRFHKGDCESDD